MVPGRIRPPHRLMRASCSLYFPLLPLLGLLLVVGLVWLFFRFYRKGPGQKKVFFPLVAASWGSWDSPSGCGSTGQPYYLWMDVVPPVRPVLAGPPPLGSPGSAPGAQRSLPPAADLKFFAQTVPPQAKHPLPTAQVPLRMGRGCVS